MGIPIFNLSTYSDKESLLKGIESIQFRGGNTNIADGLCLLLEGFKKENGARLSEGDVFRLAVVMTDGQSNEVSERCNYSTTLEVAEKVHNFSHPILVFAIGVTDNINEEELTAIATKEEYITYLDNFDERFFRETSDEQTYQLCVKSEWTWMHVIKVGHIVDKYNACVYQSVGLFTRIFIVYTRMHIYMYLHAI